ncbi:unnamed protein product [Rotaria socialis]|nr:unnamed protein product [Rotaria socialis]CAF4534234.1 unnamed protein product [Rotaria socialis]
MHSSVTASSDVAILPSINNHINYNHTESTSKPLKRSRSPSLTRDDNNESNHSLTTADTPTKKSRKRRTTIDIDQSLGRHISADKLHVYRWPADEPHADLHVLQEQICDYLSLKSFKRKYPDIYRRIVDLHEREYLKSQNVVTETQCDLGLTALKLDEVLELMSTDYPEKCHQFNTVWQQKRRALANNKNGSLTTILSLSNLNQSSISTSNSPSVNPTENGDKSRVSKFRQDILRSVVDYNAQLQRERIQERKACFDLQTMQIHYPANRQFRLPSNLTKIGSYPLALLPGQYQDSYKKYNSDELKYMPINTALYYYPKPLSLIHTERFSQQTASSDEEDEISSTNRPLLSNQQRPSTPRSPLIVNGIGAITTPSSSRLVKPSTPISINNHSAVCHGCKMTQDEHDEELVTCASCQHQFHPTCLEANSDMLSIIKTYQWQCIDCKSCAKCNKTHDEANMMFCDRCDRGYHTYCIGLEAIPDGSWQCSACDPPAPTPSISPLSATTKGKRGRPSSSSRLSPQQSTKPEVTIPTRVSSRRSRKIISAPSSPPNNTNHSSNSSSIDLPTMNSSSMNLILTRHPQQWTPNSTITPEIKKEVRPVINCFCQILSSYGFSMITSEMFCLAKYDQSEATVPLWKLMYELIHFDSNPSSQEITKDKFSQTQKDEIVNLIKNDLYKRGYTYDNFLSLDSNMQKGSRQLLVCLGWLIYHTKFIDKCIKLCLNSMSNKNKSDELQSLKYDLIEQITQVKRTNLKIRSRLRAIEQKKLQQNDRMSSFELELYQYPHLISQYLNELEKDDEKLNLFLFWNKHENIFWKWMESVLDQPTTTIENHDILYNIDCQNLEAEKQKFNAAIDTLDSALVQIQQLWISNDHRSSIQDDVSSIITSIDTEVSFLFNQLLNTNPSLKKMSLPE